MQDEQISNRAAFFERGGTRSAADLVYHDLRGRIVRLELRPDAVLSRSELAAHYGVSLTPVREALQALAEDGLVRILPQSRTLVTRIDTRQLQQAHFLRIATEIEVVRRLGEDPPAATVKRARAILGMQASLIGDADQMDLFSELDQSFHRTFFEGAGMAEIYTTVARRQGHMARCQRLELPESGRLENIVAAHREVLAGIATGGPQAAAEAMRRHLTGTITRVDGIRAAHPECFTDEAEA